MSRPATTAMLMFCLTVAAAAADLHAVIQGQWVVDEKARMEASPLYALSSPQRQKELAAGMAKAPATRFVFTATTVRVVGGEAMAYTIVKRTPTSLVLATSASSDGLMPADEMTVEYVSDAAVKLTPKSQGITLILNRAK